MITRPEALNFVEAHLKNKNLIKHCLASEAVLRTLAKHLGENEEEWALAGLLHDADVEITPAEKQGVTVGDMLADKITRAQRQAMASHNTLTGHKPETKFDYALTCGETVTGLIVASALVIPSKKLSDVTADTIVRRFGEKRFAAGADRSLISLCEKVGLSLQEFVALALSAMQGISKDIGL